MTATELAEAQARDPGTTVAAALRGAGRLGAPAIPPSAAGTASRAAGPARHRRAATAGHGPLALPCLAVSASSPHPGRRVPSPPGGRPPARKPPRRASPSQRSARPGFPGVLVITAKAALPLTRAAGMQFTATPRAVSLRGAVTRTGATREPAGVPFRQLIRIPFWIPAETGMPAHPRIPR
jgi:hypothetical protein